MQEYTVYKLVDLRDKSDRYIGVTKDPVARLKFHIRDARQGARINPALKAWIRELIGIDLSPELQKLETISVPDNAEAVAREREQHWIQELLKQGTRLLNVEGVTRTYASSSSFNYLARVVRLEQVKQYRLRARLSIAQLARIARIDETTVRRAERGEAVQEVKAFAIAEALSQELGQSLSIEDLGIVIYGIESDKD